MSDVLTYKGYRARIEFDAEDRIFFGRVAGIEDGVGFHGETVDELVTAFQEAVDDYAETCGRIGKKSEPELLRLVLNAELRERVADAAREAGQTLDEFGADALQAAIARAASQRLAAMGGSQPDFRPPPRRRFE